jgi:hypothetical protein
MGIVNRTLRRPASSLLVLGMIVTNPTLSMAADATSARSHSEVSGDPRGRGHYPPSRGGWVRTLPPSQRRYDYRGRPFYFYNGFWYERRPGGYFVVRPPLGLHMPVPPPFYTTVWIDGVPYYYANDTYYRWIDSRNAYEIVAPPPGFDAAHPESPIPPKEELVPQSFVYPRNGQSAEQQSADRYACHTWSKGQAGFDPTQGGGGVAPEDIGSRSGQYQRALNACLEGRGYSVK